MSPLGLLLRHLSRKASVIGVERLVSKAFKVHHSRHLTCQDLPSYHVRKCMNVDIYALPESYAECVLVVR